MKTINKISNQKGITLLEVLLSITILSIILVSMMYIFPQMGLINQKGEERTQAVNTSKQILVEWQKNQQIKDFLSGLTGLPENLIEHDTYYQTELIKDDVNIIIKISKDSDIRSVPGKAHQIHVELQDETNSKIGESFGYIIVEE